MTTEAEITEAEIEADLAVAKEEASADQDSQERCIKLYAQSADRNAKFHSSLQKASQYVVASVLRNLEKTDNFSLVSRY